MDLAKVDETFACVLEVSTVWSRGLCQPVRKASIANTWKEKLNLV